MKTNVEQALDEAVAALYFGDSSEYSIALWMVVSLLGGKEAAELLDQNPSAAFHKYCR